jgi:3-hydroxyisobutyrate dehydrogenase-like beta-hydroxyacid dehydrogenase
MGASIGAALKARAGQVIWAAAGRSYETSKRAELADLVAVRDVAELVRCADVVISICPPAAALDVAAEVASVGRPGLYVDANAIAVETVEEIERMFGTDHVVDAAIIGPPAWRAGSTVLWAAGLQAETFGELFGGSAVEARVLGEQLGSASVLKACFALQSKALPALWFTLAAAAREYGVDDAVRLELTRDGIDLDVELGRITERAATKAWRWSGEMDEAAKVLRALGLPDGFSSSAAEVYRQLAAVVRKAGDLDSATAVEAVRRPTG